MQLYLSSPLDPKGVVDVLNWCLEAVMGWVRTNKLRFLTSLLKVLLVGSSLVLRSICISVLAGVVQTPKLFEVCVYFWTWGCSYMSRYQLLPGACTSNFGWCTNCDPPLLRRTSLSPSASVTWGQPSSHTPTIRRTTGRG